jgi:glutaredoxin-like protein NrdH
MKLIVFSKNKCPKCDALKMALENFPDGPIEFEERNIEEKPEYREQFDKYGVMEAPLTVFPDDTFVTGYDLGKLQNKLGI